MFNKIQPDDISSKRGDQHATNGKMPFFKILEVLEHLAGISEREAIRRVGVPRSTYRSWKYGTCEPSRRTHWRSLSTAFEVPVSLLISGLSIETIAQFEASRRRREGYTPSPVQFSERGQV